MDSGECIVEGRRADGEVDWLYFTKPLEVIRAGRVEEVASGLAAVEDAVSHGSSAAGFICYEAAPAFDGSFRTKTPSPLPLLWFGIYSEAQRFSAPPVSAGGCFESGGWEPSVSRERYQKAIGKIKAYIAAGDTYQVNYTIRLRSRFQGDPYAFWLKLLRSQPVGYSACIDTGRFVLCSASPELFLSLRGSELISRPMKGTSPRGRTSDEDRAKIEWLKGSDKNRAENLMIVDMVRNDLGRVAETGSVRVESLFDIERYPTILQMTSTVGSETKAPTPEIIAALFPCASITGAPKIRTMEIIAGLEDGPRGIYTGAIGFILPGRRAQFNVAIRTVMIDREAEKAEYGVGGGIVWDSESDDEYSECLTKAKVLTEDIPDFELLESLLWKKGTGYFLPERHLQRLKDSAEYFGFPVDTVRVRERLRELKESLPGPARKVRLRVDRLGGISLDHEPLDEKDNRRTRKLALAREPIDPENPFLYHKTTNREIYENARASRRGCDDVLLWNNRGELTEATIANLVVKIGGEYFTPPVGCGLLPGTFRAELLKRGKIREKIIRRDDLKKCAAVYLVNSVRKWVKAELLPDRSPLAIV